MQADRDTVLSAVVEIARLAAVGADLTALVQVVAQIGWGGRYGRYVVV